MIPDSNPKHWQNLLVPTLLHEPDSSGSRPEASDTAAKPPAAHGQAMHVVATQQPRARVAISVEAVDRAVVLVKDLIDTWPGSIMRVQRRVGWTTVLLGNNYKSKVPANDRLQKLYSSSIPASSAPTSSQQFSPSLSPSMTTWGHPHLHAGALARTSSMMQHRPALGVCGLNTPRIDSMSQFRKPCLEIRRKVVFCI